MTSMTHRIGTALAGTGALLALLLLASSVEAQTRRPAAAPLGPTEPMFSTGATGCETAGCHQGIESIGSDMDWLSCVVCHKGDGGATQMEAAHTGMFSNPGDFRVVDQTCGLCHPEIVDKSMKSLHATSAGVISGTRWTWNAQDTKESIYGTVDVMDVDGNVPTEHGAQYRLEKIPSYDPRQPEGPTNSPADDYLRNQCLRCHLWSGGHERDGDWRASGCSACHVLYADDGLYQGSDPTIDRSEKGHPIRHKITDKIPETQCIHCHNRGGRTGVSFIGTMESDGYGSPWAGGGEKQSKLHGKNYNHLTADVHYEHGMTCIDCHTKQDLHGDGNIYGKKELAVEIECEDCHGTIDARSTLTTSWGNEMKNLALENGQVVLKRRLDEHLMVVPQIVDIDPASEAGVAMKVVEEHVEHLECYACHARWAPQCYGCHAKQDLGVTARDWVDPVFDLDDPSKTAKKAAADASQECYGWSETRSYLRWESPVLGVNGDSEGNKVAPFVPGCQVFFTQIGADGSTLVKNQTFTAADGSSGIAHNPIQPHTISHEARKCPDCHNNPKALGLGIGTFDPVASGLGIDFGLDRIVDEDGNPIQTTSHDGARPLNRHEMDEMAMDRDCESCHVGGVR